VLINVRNLEEVNRQREGDLREAMDRITILQLLVCPSVLWNTLKYGASKESFETGSKIKACIT
jgi:hypothetical protein